MNTRHVAEVGRQSAWRRFWTRLGAIEEAMSITHDDIQDRRLDKLERELSDMKAAVQRATALLRD